VILKSSIIGRGPVIIILHGLFGESKNWKSVASKLSNYFEVHLVDQRNHGNSFHHKQHDYKAMALDLKNYIEKRKINTFSIIGHSMGGKVAMQFAFLYPRRLKKLIVIDISPREYKDNHTDVFLGLKQVLLESKSRQSAQKTLMSYINDEVKSNFLLKGLFFTSTKTPHLKFNLVAIQKNIHNMLSSLHSDILFDGETYFLSGANSNYIQRRDVKYISKLFSLYKIIEIKNAGHWIHYDNKSDFLKTIGQIFNL